MTERERHTRMTATALRALKGVSRSFSIFDAEDVASEHCKRRFSKLLSRQNPEFSCASFVAFCRKDLRTFARRRGVQLARKAGNEVSLDASLTGDVPDGITLYDILGVDPKRLTDTERKELGELVERALSDLTEIDKEIVTPWIAEYVQA